MVIINKLQDYKTIIIMTTIALSNNTAELLNCKKNLDECYATLGEVQNKLFGYDEEFEKKVGCAYAAINEAIMQLMAGSIDVESTNSQYKAI